MNGFQLPRIEFITIIPGLPPIPWIVFGDMMAPPVIQPIEPPTIKDHDVDVSSTVPINYIDNYTIEIRGDSPVPPEQTSARFPQAYQRLKVVYPIYARINVYDENNNLLYQTEELRIIPDQGRLNVFKSIANLTTNSYYLMGQITTLDEFRTEYTEISVVGNNWGSDFVVNTITKDLEKLDTEASVESETVNGMPYAIQIEQTSPR